MSYLQGNIITNIDDAEAASPTMVFSFGMKAGNKSQPKNRKPGKRSTSLTTEDLRDDAKLLAWFQTATRRKHPSLKNCDADCRFVFEAAERALSEGNDPPALFMFIINNNRRDYITQAQEDRARQRLRRLRNPEREAERKRRHDDDDDDTQPRTEPVAVGDILQKLVNSILPKTSIRSDANHA